MSAVSGSRTQVGRRLGRGRAGGALVWVLGVLAIVAAVGLGIGWMVREHRLALAAAKAREASARVAMDQAQAEEAAARADLYAGDMALALAAHANGESPRVRSILGRQTPARGKRDLRGWEWHFLEGQVRSDAVGVLGSLAGEGQRVVVVPGGRRVLGADNAGGVVEWDLESGKEIRRGTLRAPGLSGLEVAPDGSWFVINHRVPGATNTLVQFIDLMGWTTNRVWAAPGMVGPRAVSADGSTVWLTGRESLVELSVANGSVREIPLPAQTRPAALALSPVVPWLVVSHGPRAVAWVPMDGPADLSVRRWETGAMAGADSEVEVTCLRFSADGRWLLSGLSDGRVLVWDAEQRAVVSTWTGHATSVLAIRFGHDDSQVVTVGRDAFGLVREFPSGREVARVRGLEGFSQDVAWSGDELLVVGSAAEVRRWRPQAARGWVSLTNGPAAMLGASLLPDGGHALVSAADGVQVWTLPAGEVIRALPTDADALASAFAYSTNAPAGLAARYWVGGRIGVRSLELEGKTTTVDEPGWVPVPRFSGSADLTFDAAGRQLAVADTANGVRVYGVEPLALKHRFEMPLARSVVFSADGRRLAAVGEGRLAVWDLSRPEPMAQEHVLPQVQAAAFSPTGDRVLAATLDGRVSIFPVGGAKDTGTTLASVPRAYLSVGMSVDGSRVAAGSVDGGVVLWDAKTRRELGLLRVGTTPVYAVRFTDGRTLVVASGDGVRVLSY